MIDSGSPCAQASWRRARRRLGFGVALGACSSTQEGPGGRAGLRRRLAAGICLHASHPAARLQSSRIFSVPSQAAGTHLGRAGAPRGRLPSAGVGRASLRGHTGPRGSVSDSAVLVAPAEGDILSLPLPPVEQKGFPRGGMTPACTPLAGWQGPSPQGAGTWPHPRTCHGHLPAAAAGVPGGGECNHAQQQPFGAFGCPAHPWKAWASGARPPFLCWKGRRALCCHLGRRELVGRRASWAGERRVGSGVTMSSPDLHGGGRRPACRDLQACHA